MHDGSPALVTKDFLEEVSFSRDVYRFSESLPLAPLYQMLSGKEGLEEPSREKKKHVSRWEAAE